MGQMEGCLAMLGLKDERLLGWRAGGFLPDLKADCVPGWRAVWLLSAEGHIG